MLFKLFCNKAKNKQLTHLFPMYKKKYVLFSPILTVRNTKKIVGEEEETDSYVSMCTATYKIWMSSKKIDNWKFFIGREMRE